MVSAPANGGRPKIRAAVIKKHPHGVYCEGDNAPTGLEPATSLRHPSLAWQQIERMETL